jgi:hypothetical protein
LAERAERAVDRHQQTLQAFVDIIGDPYSGEVDGKRIGQPRSGSSSQVSVTVENSAGDEAVMADYCRWDCFRVVCRLEAGTLDLLGDSSTTRLVSYNRAVQELQPLVSCLAIRQHDGSWLLSQICCRHEKLFSAT